MKFLYLLILNKHFFVFYLYYTERNFYYLKLFLLFGIVFEIPVATLLLVLLNIVSTDKLIKSRRYVIVGCFFIAALVTPPDGLSMLMLAIPMCLLFEVGILLAKLLKRSTKTA